MIIRNRAAFLAAPMLVALAGLTACASGEPPDARLSAARAAIETAQRSGATENAPVEINTARDKLSRAEAAARQSQNQEANWLAEQAQIDAEVAGTRAQSVAAEQALQQIREGTTALGTELQRPATPR